MKKFITRAAALVGCSQWRGPLVEQARRSDVLDIPRVVSLVQAAKAWEDTLCPVEAVPLRYEMATLINCANENKAKKAWWFLVWCFGFSLRKQRERIEEWHLPESRRYFDSDEWWLGLSENRWADKNYRGGYYLIDFYQRFCGMTWQAQEGAIRKLGSVRRAPEAMVAEAAITLHRTGRGHFLRDWYHWGSFLDSSKRRIYIGNLDIAKGLYIGGGEPCKPGPNLCAVIVREWDF